MRAGRKKPVQREKFEQAHVIDLMKRFGGKEYVLGTRRPAGRRCPKCGEFVREHQGTCQTPGVADVLMFMPALDDRAARRYRFLAIECKAPGGRMSAEQREFKDFCDGAGIEHILGGLDAAIAWLVVNGYAKTHQFPHYRVEHISPSSQAV
jgi:hypothetical protein